jgi:hypothetical protein
MGNFWKLRGSKAHLKIEGEGHENRHQRHAGVFRIGRHAGENLVLPTLSSGGCGMILTVSDDDRKASS